MSIGVVVFCLKMFLPALPYTGNVDNLCIMWLLCVMCTGIISNAIMCIIRTSYSCCLVIIENSVSCNILPLCPWHLSCVSQQKIRKCNVILICISGKCIWSNCVVVLLVRFLLCLCIRKCIVSSVRYLLGVRLLFSYYQYIARFVAGIQSYLLTLWCCLYCYC